MVEAAVVEELRELIEALARERARAAAVKGESLDIHLHFYADTPVIASAVPFPPATEAEIAEAEAALGRAYPPEYRALLSIANGFPAYFIADVLLGTHGVGTHYSESIYGEHYPASAWGFAREYIDMWYSEGGDKPDHSPVDPSECVPLVYGTENMGTAYVVATDGADWKANTVVHISSGGDVLFPSIRDYLRYGLDVSGTLYD
ncbi:SMI1/KNR4 family protein [Tsukamurella ocularis]|uniref:SMI1/KNR4 family protein n=1 Tax=Tsukamurella ocularis TaxID=1970234 RepID=UPI0039EFE532